MDSWTADQIQVMRVGGNNKMNEFLQSYKCNFEQRFPDIGQRIKEKYNSPHAVLHKQRLKAEMEGKPLPTQLPEVQRGPTPEEMRARINGGRSGGGGGGGSEKVIYGGIGSDPSYRPGQSGGGGLLSEIGLDQVDTAALQENASKVVENTWSLLGQLGGKLSELGQSLADDGNGGGGGGGGFPRPEGFPRPDGYGGGTIGGKKMDSIEGPMSYNSSSSSSNNNNNNDGGGVMGSIWGSVGSVTSNLATSIVDGYDESAGGGGGGGGGGYGERSSSSSSSGGGGGGMTGSTGNGGGYGNISNSNSNSNIGGNGGRSSSNGSDLSDLGLGGGSNSGSNNSLGMRSESPIATANAHANAAAAQPSISGVAAGVSGMSLGGGGGGGEAGTNPAAADIAVKSKKQEDDFFEDW
jgi:hypothetical protein